MVSSRSMICISRLFYVYLYYEQFCSELKLTNMNKLNTLKRVLGKNVKVGTKIIDKKYECIYEVTWHEKDTRDNLIRVGVKDIKPIEVMCWGDTPVKPIDAEDLENEIYNEDAVGYEALRYTIYK